MFGMDADTRKDVPMELSPSPKIYLIQDDKKRPMESVSSDEDSLIPPPTKRQEGSSDLKVPASSSSSSTALPSRNSASVEASFSSTSSSSTTPPKRSGVPIKNRIFDFSKYAAVVAQYRASEVGLGYSYPKDLVIVVCHLYTKMKAPSEAYSTTCRNVGSEFQISYEVVNTIIQENTKLLGQMKNDGIPAATLPMQQPESIQQMMVAAAPIPLIAPIPSLVTPKPEQRERRPMLGLSALAASCAWHRGAIVETPTSLTTSPHAQTARDFLSKRDLPFQQEDGTVILPPLEKNGDASHETVLSSERTMSDDDQDVANVLSSLSMPPQR
jgi:hypothetical protein